jgi:hypothetical protein
MTLQIDFTGWTKRDGELHLDGFDDVTVRCGTSDDEPFIGSVGFFSESFRRLEPAMRYAEELAHERAVFLSPDPLPAPAEADPEQTADEKFLFARGLTL